ncbi:MAG: hypothetical protein R2723_01945 [Microbacterium sp.]
MSSSTSARHPKLHSRQQHALRLLSYICHVGSGREFDDAHLDLLVWLFLLDDGQRLVLTSSF